jgi:hypothetical protein
MEKFSSNSSRLVKLITLSTFTLLVLVAFVLIIVEGRLGSISGIIFLVVVMGSAFYFYSQSLKELIITDTHLILKKNLSKVVIDFEDIESVVKLEYADIPMVPNIRKSSQKNAAKPYCIRLCSYVIFT